MEWQTIDGVGATNAVWAAPNGAGVGPVHGPHCANKFPDGGPPAGPPPDILPTAASFKVIFLDGTVVPCTNLFDPVTAIGRSDPFTEGAPPLMVNGSDAAPIMGAAAGLYPLTSAIGLEPLAPPNGFPEGDAGRWEAHTEMLSLNLMGACGTIRAGQPYLASVIGSGTRLEPILLANEHRFSFGEVASLHATDVCNAFPADSYFNIFVEIDAPGGPYYNLTPMIVRATIGEFPPNLSLPESVYVHDPTFPPVPLYNGDGCHIGYLQSAGHGSTPPPIPEIPETPEPLPLIGGPVTFAIDPLTEGLEPGVEGPAPNEVWDDSHPFIPERLLTAYESSATGGIPNMTNAGVGELVGEIEDPDVNPPRGFIDGDAINSFSFGRDGTLEPTFFQERSGNLFFSVGFNSDGTDGVTAVGVAKTLRDEAASVFATTVGAFGDYADRPTISLPNPAGAGTNYLVQGSLALGLRGGLCNQLGGLDNVIALEIDDYDATGDSYYLSLIGEAAIIRNDCNGNGMPDSCDIDSGLSADGNGNDVPDGCENDCNGNGVADACDIDCGISMDPCDVPGCGGSTDANGNGVPDECEPDCNGNGVRDADDIATATSDDDNGNGVPDECERAGAIFVYQNQSDPGPYRLCDLTVFATASDLGLTDLDVIDALVLSDVTPGLPLGLQEPNGVMDVDSDEVLFSLSPTSPTVIALGASGADLFYSDFDGTFVPFAAADLGLLTTADVDAADIGPSVKGACWEPEPEDPENPSCIEVTREQCKQAQWLYAGDDTTCPTASVPATGACCLRNASCQDNTGEWCDLNGGTYQGDGEVCCDGTVCAAVEACCLPGGVCTMDDPLCCNDIGGAPLGAGSACLGDNNGDGIDDVCTLPIPTVSEWGLIVMALLALTAGTLVYTRRRPTPA